MNIDYKNIYILLLILLSIGSSVYSQTNTCERAKQIIDTLNKNHYAPRLLNEQFSEYVFDYFIEAIDKDHLIFSKEDYAYFVNHKTKLSEEILQNNCSFAIKFINFYKNESEKDFPVIVDFYLKKEAFEKAQAIINAKSSKSRTQEDIDKYNLASNEYNEAVNVYNKKINDMNNERNSLFNEWNNTISHYFENYAR